LTLGITQNTATACLSFVPPHNPMRVKKFTLLRTITTTLPHYHLSPHHHHYPSPHTTTTLPQISQSIDRLAETAREIANSRSRATTKFLELYSDFALEDKVRAFNLFKNEATAEVFLSMTNVESRDLWLQTKLEEFA